MLSIGHGALGAPTSLVGGAALAGVAAHPSQEKLKKLEEKLKMKKAEDQEGKPLPVNDQNLDWETVVGEKLNRFSQLLRSEIVRLKLKKLSDKIKE
jgi:hypothetical protein